MRFKNICTTVLLVFVAASIVVLLVKGLRPGNPTTTTDDRFDGLIVCYFHRTARCPACRSIEVYSHEAVIKGFPAEVGDGRVEWRAVDFELPENQHFAEDYKLIAPSVVLVEMQDGTRKRWKNLPEVWELVGDKPAFVVFVQKEIQAFLNAR